MLLSFGSDDEEMRIPTHGAMYARFEEGCLEDENITGRCFVSAGAYMSPMTSKVHSPLESINIPSRSCLTVLSDFDDILSHVNDMLIFVSCKSERSKNLLLDTQNHLESKKSRIDSL